MSRDRTPLLIGAILVVLLAAGPFIPQWAIFIITIAFAKGLVALGLMLLLRAGLVKPSMDLLVRRIIVIAAIAWIPLLVLTLLSGTAVGDHRFRRPTFLSAPWR